MRLEGAKGENAWSAVEAAVDIAIRNCQNRGDCYPTHKKLKTYMNKRASSVHVLCLVLA